jgi:phosphate transport system protein
MGAERLRELPLDVVRLASLATNAVAAGTEALVNGDLAAAQRVVDDDDEVDTLRHSIEDDCLVLLADPGMAAADLRFVAGTLRVVYELERSADLMVNVAKTTWRLRPIPSTQHRVRIVEAHGSSGRSAAPGRSERFRRSRRFVGIRLADMDEAMDELQQSLFRRILGEHS